MASTVTVTGKEAGAITVTAKVFSNARGVTFDFDRQLIKVLQQNDQIEDVDISAATTITATVSSGNYTFIVS